MTARHFLSNRLAVVGLIASLALIGVAMSAPSTSWINRLALLLNLLSISAPTFVVGVILLYVLGYVVPIFALGGYGGFSNLVLPALALGFGGAGWYARTLRTTMLDVLGMDYVRTARAKGVRALSIALRHVMRNALGPIATNLGLDMAYFLGGVLVVETVFGWPGIGLLGYEAIGYQDVPVLMGTVLFSALVIVLMNLVIDISYGVLDARVRYE